LSTFSEDIFESGNEARREGSGGTGGGWMEMDLDEDLLEKGADVGEESEAVEMEETGRNFDEI
jgi:hypothetical protein